ncbi:MAG: hypothetical protein ACXWIU_15230 [Limisphaerales bacterium]
MASTTLAQIGSGKGDIMQRWFLLILVLVFQVPNLYAFEGNQEIAECKSKNVWDAGFVLQFDLNAHAGDETAQIPSKIFQLVPLWKQQLEFSGSLVPVPSLSREGCEVFLTDDLVAPTVEVRFKISSGAQDIELVELHGVKPEKWTTLECQPALIERLTRECLAAQ